jgi:hypothetical protein
LVWIILVVPQGVLAPKIEDPEPSQWILISGDTLKANFIQYQKPNTFGAILECLEYYESKICETQNRERCVGKAGEIGCLQFLPATFRNYCIETYGVAKGMADIYICEIQRRCAQRMLEEDFNLIENWSVASKCVK